MRRFNFGKKEDGHEAKNLVPFGGHDLLDNIFEKFFNEPFGFGFTSLDIARKPMLDIYEKGGKMVVKADLPGVDKKDINIRVDDGILTISGNKKVEKELKKDDFYHLERSYGTIQRSVRLPRGVKEDEIRAAYKDGVLTLEIPKSDKETENGRRIDIE